MPRTSVLPQDQSDDGLLNDETRAVVVALSDAAESIKLARDGRKKALATKYATPEKRLEERLEAAAVGLTSSFANLCRDFGAEFRDFDTATKLELRKQESEISEINGAVKYSMDPKKGLKNAESLEVKVQSIKNRVDMAMTSWSARVFADMRAALERDRRMLALSEAQERDPTHPEDATFEEPPPMYEESASHGELPSEARMFNARLNSDGHLATAQRAPTVRSSSANAQTAATSSNAGAPPASSRAPPPVPASADIIGRHSRASPMQTPMPGLYRSSETSPLQYRASAPAVPTGSLSQTQTRDISGSPPDPFVHTMSLPTFQSIRATQRQSTTDSNSLPSTLGSPAGPGSPAQQLSSFSPPQRTSTISSTGSSQPQSPTLQQPSFLTPGHRTSTVSSFNSSNSQPPSSPPKRTKTLADLANDDAVSWNPPLNRTSSGSPCRSNSYWGICKGAWAIASAAPKALDTVYVPLGMHSFIRYIRCKECHFQGKFVGEVNKIPVPDPCIYTHAATGLRFRWAFLAKSHIKCKDGSLGAGLFFFKQQYGCVFCIENGRWPPTLSGVDALMYHILRFHTGDAANPEGATGNEVMPDWVQRKHTIVTGRIALPENKFDLNIPKGYEEKLREETMATGGEEAEAVEMGEGTPLPRELQA